MSGNNKRPRDDKKISPPKPTAPIPNGPFIPMFTTFREELDEHHDRRERVIKASRDITALSKKMIFTLQRMKTIPQNKTLPPHISSDLSSNESKIQFLITSIAPELQNINAYRYQRQISGGVQEYIEALSFRHYLLHGELITMKEVQQYISGSMQNEGENTEEEDGEEGVREGEESVKKLKIDNSLPLSTQEDRKADAPALILTPSDYILGLFDLVGEIMRFAITSIATTSLPSPSSPTALTVPPVLNHLRDLRLAFEYIDTTGGGMGLAKDVDKKMEVMRVCVEKVEVAMYGMIVRGRERPEGWVMDVPAGNTGGRDEE